MAYKRRYLSGQLAVTVDIADEAVTTDKIGDGAVGPTQLKDDSISTEKIIDGQVKVDDIGPLAVTTEKIQQGAVTEGKIASGAVTSAKLGTDVQQSVRPFVPGLPTAEIGDGAITAVKIGAEAVETDKLKDGAVDSDKIAFQAVNAGKIAPDSIGSDQIVASAIKTAELDNLSVSEGKIIDGSVSEDKLAANAVTEVKILDDAVTEDKILDDAVTEDKILDDAVTTLKLQAAAIARRHINSLFVRESLFYEDFGGNSLSNRWVSAGDVGGGIIPDGANGIKIQTGPVLHDTQEITFGGNGIVIPNTHKPSIMFMLTGRTDPKNNFRTWMGLRKDISNYITFTINDVGAGATKWQAECKSVGASTIVDTGVLTTDGVELFEIDISDPASIKFYLNSALVATITTNIPAAQLLEPWFYVDTGDAVAKYWILKYVNIMAEKPTWA